ncbi:hypothetical protein [Tortoise microvirus 88]|nr:hypothetical protein [Tortoise microvirus 88]
MSHSVEVIPIMVIIPTPFSAVSRDEIGGQSVLMRGLKLSRFRGSLGEQVILPLRTAVRLEQFEAALRDAGFIAPNEGLLQSGDDGTKFRVKKFLGPNRCAEVNHGVLPPDEL